MLQNSSELNQTIHTAAQRILEHAANQTKDGCFEVYYEIVSNVIDYEDFLVHAESIADELSTRKEVKGVEFTEDTFCLKLDPNFCPNYQWQKGDEERLGITREEWAPKPISRPLDPNRLAEIGEKAISYVLEVSDTALEDLTECLGMSIAELEQLGIYQMVEPKSTHSFAVVDMEAGLSAHYKTFDEALSAYNELPVHEKRIDAIVPQKDPIHILMEADGYDVLCNTRTDLPFVRDLRDRLSCTPVDAAFQRAQQYVEKKYPILFYVHHGMQERNAAAPHPCFETALEELRSSGREECSLGYLIFDQGGRGKGGTLLQSDEFSVPRPCAIADRALKNPHIALAHAKAILAVYPNDEKAWALRDDAESKLGISDRTVDTSQDLLLGKWRVQYIPPGGHYGSHNQLINDSKRAFVQFYDMSQDKEKFPNGQSTGAQYYVSTLLDSTDYPFGLRLDFDIPTWTVSREEMKEVLAYLKAQEERYNPRKPLIEQLYEAEDRSGRPFPPDDQGLDDPGR